MERRYFELAKGGYLHVYPDALVVTRSGNWGEADRTPERSFSRRIGHGWRLVTGLFLIVIGGIAVAAEHAHLFGGGGPVYLAMGAVLGIWEMIDRFKHDMAASFRIPFAKVLSMQQKERGLHIHFMNASLIEEEVVIRTTADPAAYAFEAWQAFNVQA